MSTSISKLRNDLKKKVIAQATFNAAFRRAGIYNDGVDSKEKTEFRKGLQHLLEKRARAYREAKKVISDEIHYKNIERIQQWSNDKFPDLLKEKELNIGISQKLLNVYLKLLWCFEDNMQAPPHCPFDSIILKKININDKWTKTTNISIYKNWVFKAEKAAGKGRLAEWEMELYHRTYLRHK